MIQKDVRPLLSIICLVAWVWFYVAKVFGAEIPLEINVLWAPVAWWFASRQNDKRKEKK